MNTRRAAVGLAWSLILIVTGMVGAQDTSGDDGRCPSIVNVALDATDNQCVNTGRNQACYGSLHVDLEPRPDYESVTFEQTGDQFDLAAVKSLTLSAMDEAAGEWGIALLRVQANIPDTLPGQNVIFLLFGDVTITDEREAPDAHPMQAFTFKSGIGDAGCDTAPDSGILIRTPEGAGEIELTSNGVEITLGSTIYVQAEPEGDMTVSLLDGGATVTAQGVTVTLEPGDRTTIPMDASLQPAGPPSNPLPYAPGSLDALPLSSLDVAEGAAPGGPPIAGGGINEGQWQLTVTRSASGTCAFSEGIVNVAVKGDTLVLTGATELALLAQEPTAFNGEPQVDGQDAYVLVLALSPNHMEASQQGSAGVCFAALDYIGPADGGDDSSLVPLDGQWSMVSIDGPCEASPGPVSITNVENGIDLGGGKVEQTAPGVYEWEGELQGFDEIATYRVTSPEHIDYELTIVDVYQCTFALDYLGPGN